MFQGSTTRLLTNAQTINWGNHSLGPSTDFTTALNFFGRMEYAPSWAYGYAVVFGFFSAITALAPAA
ncbi:uncharacterized protein N7525_004256 [Penicillium rubens]|uniref:uncharacterized protein n=1 Tax=Penicillium rubens TaxID=1108849 RepID=UPI002A59C99C|nr:uncharacterized protein N7525_004256 [Penicillium rubens]KAJ5839068.1 hypothetical protein N7525_004256 [Penicillium rubens]